MKVRDLLRLVEADGWRHVRTTGSYRHYKHPSKPNVVTKMSTKYAVVFEQADNNWTAYVPDLPACITTGRTLQETEDNIREAIEGHLRTLREFGDPVPRATSVAKEIEVSPLA